MECINCGHEVQGNYCSHCGQKTSYNRYTFRSLIGNFFNNLFNFEKGFWLTIKMLIINPSEVISTYLKGNTIRYFNPIKLFLFTSFIHTFIILQFGLFDQSIVGMQDYNVVDDGVSEFQLKIFEYIKKYMSFVNLLNIPLFSLSTLLLYRKKKYNYAEHMIVNTYTLASYVTLSITISILLILLPSFSAYYTPGATFIMFLVYLYVFRSFYKDSWGKTLLKTLLVSIMSIFFLMLIGIVITVIIVIIAGPEILQRH